MTETNSSYLVCATPRSGSTLICQALKATGVAGRPEEYFEALRHSGRPRRPEEYFEGVDDRSILGHLGERGVGDEPAQRSPLWSRTAYDRYLEWALEGDSLMPLVRGAVDRVHDAVFGELTYHAAYQPQRSVRTERWKYIRRFGDNPRPVLVNCDDSASKDLLIEHGWGEEEIPVEQLYDLALDPNEGHNLAGLEAKDPALEELRARLEVWMREREDPLLDGPVPTPVGAELNDPGQVSPAEPTDIVTADPTAVTST